MKSWALSVPLPFHQFRNGLYVSLCVCKEDTKRETEEKREGKRESECVREKEGEREKRNRERKRMASTRLTT